MSNNDKKKYTVSFFAFIIAAVWIFAAIFNFLNNLMTIETTSTNSELVDVAACNAAETNAIFERYTKTLSAVGKSVERYDSFISDEVISFLKDIATGDSFSNLSIDLGNGITHSLNWTSTKTPDFYDLSMIKSGKPFILDVMDFDSDGNYEVNVVVPLKNKDGGYTDALRGTILVDTLTSVFEKTFATAGGYYYHIIDGNGRYISSGNYKTALLMDENFFDAIEKLTYNKGFSSAQIVNAFTKNEKGYSQYSYGSEERYAYYIPVGINNWVMTMVIQKDIVEQTASDHLLNAVWLMLQIVIVLLFFVFFAYFTQKRASDIAKLNEKCFKVLTEQTSKAIFEWDYETSEIKYLSDIKSLFNIEPVAFMSPEQAMSSNSIHSDDSVELDKLFAAIAAAENISNITFRIANSSGAYNWCEVSLTFVKKHNGEPYKAVGFIENIDERVKKEEQLRKKSETDQLTGVYNKSTTEYMIEAVLSTANASIDGDMHALIVLDIDNYKDINDMLGHLYGDIVLAQIASTLKSIFRTDDIVGRLGGDEFFVFLKNYGSAKILSERARSVCEKLHKTFSEGAASVTISASVGIAIFPENGTTFEQLYKAADIALYNVKASGKNSYMVYDGLKMQHYISNRTDIDIEGGQQKSYNGNKLEYIFKLLYDSENVRLAVTSVLQLVTEQFAFSRACIYEIDDSGKSFSCIYEWCADGVASTKAMQQGIPVEKSYIITDLLRIYGGMCEKSISDLPIDFRAAYEEAGIKSFTSFAIMSGADIVGNITFQNCNLDRITLSKIELGEVRTICQVLTTFILKQRITQQEVQYRDALENMLNTIDSFAYVIDQSSWRVLFESRKIARVAQHDNIGKICYEAYCNRKSPCEGCPILAINSGADAATVEIDNKDYDIVSKTTATRINWINGVAAYLINSIDITEYKKGEG